MSTHERAAIIASATTGIDALLVLADAAPEAVHKVYHGRSTADVLAHLIGWHDLLLDWIGCWREDEEVDFPAPGYTWDDLEALNTSLWKARKGEPYGDIRTELLESHQAALAALASVTHQELAQPTLTPWTSGEALGSVFHECLGAHYAWALSVLSPTTGEPS